MWQHDQASGGPGDLAKSVEPRFNRAIIFDTTQNSWHGLPEPITAPEDQFRNSLAAYYLIPAPSGTDPRGKALFAPTDEQKDDPEVLELIRNRSNVQIANEAYRNG